MTSEQKLQALEIGGKVAALNQQLIDLLRGVEANEGYPVFIAVKLFSIGCSELYDSLPKSTSVPDPAELDRLLSVEPEDVNNKIERL